LTRAGGPGSSSAKTGPAVVALGSDVFGGSVAALERLGIPSTEAGRYEAKIKHGYVLVGVRADGADQQKRAETAYESAGAKDVEVANAQY
jgi:hypothetical protein